MNDEVTQFIKKQKQWQKEISKLRSVLLTTKLEEHFKWKLPCYTYHDTNVVIIQPFKAALALMFFKGALLKDPKKLLAQNGPNSQSAKRLEFKSSEEITKFSAVIKSYIKEAIAIEEAGLKVEFKKELGSIPAELKNAFSKKAAFKKAFDSLTPGRQRAYLLHFSSAKQSATRISRIEKCMPRILAGKGLTDN